MQGWERHAERLARRGLMASWESQTDSQAARLAKVLVQRVGQNEIGSGQLDRAQGTGQSKRVRAGWAWGLKKVPKHQEFSAWREGSINIWDMTPRRTQ